MLCVVSITGFRGQCMEDSCDPTRPVRRDLLANAEVQPHVQERISLAAFDGEIPVEVTTHSIPILRMVINDLSDLRLER